jgi:hypothetical protein
MTSPRRSFPLGSKAFARVRRRRELPDAAITVAHPARAFARVSGGFFEARPGPGFADVAPMRRSRLWISSLLLATAVAATGCADAPPPPAESAPKPEVVDRRTALATARRDASFQYGGEAWIARTDVRQLGRFWIVELHAQNGSLVRYAISTRDGAIRERGLLQ